MDISGLNSVLPQILIQLLRHAFRQRRHQTAFIAMNPKLNLVHQVIHLVFSRTHLDLRI